MSCNPVFTLARKSLQLVLILAVSLPAWGATATTTSLTTGSKTVNSRTITTLTAKVSPTTITQGLVHFYDGKILLGTAQIVNTGTKYVHGAAYLSAELGAGTHSLTASFAGTASYLTSTSTAASVNVPGGSTSTAISSTGTAGNYTLTGQVIADGTLAVSGNVAFIDQTAGNVTIGTAPLGTATAKKAFAAAAGYPLYAPTGNDNPQQVVVADLNGDGILDIVDIASSEKISVHLGKGDGTFQAATSFCMIPGSNPPKPCDGGYVPSSISAGDFNGDGMPDLVFGGGSAVNIALGNGDGTFQEPEIYQTQGTNSEVLVADLNRDGTPDLVASITKGVSILLGIGDGTFQPHYEVALLNPSQYITIGDFNKDRIPDVAAAGWNGSKLAVLLGVGDGTFLAEKDTTVINTAGCSVAAADFKGTGFLSDIALCGGGKAQALVGNGDGTFAAPQSLLPNSTFSVYVKWLKPVDVNGDGIVDLALVWYSSTTDVGRIGIFTGIGDGTFNATPSTLITGKEPVFAAVGDLNGDGTFDLVTANDTDDNLSVLLNKTTSTATATLANVAVPGTGNQSVVAKYAGDTRYATSTSSAITLTGTGVATGPAISSLAPATVASGSGAFTLTVNGSGFVAGAVVKWNGSARTTQLVSAVKLTAAISANDVAAAGTYAISVQNGTTLPASNAVNFSVTQSTTGPTITGLSPNYILVNSPATTITVTGTLFVSGSVVHWGTASLITTYVNATTLTAVVPVANLKTLGSFPISVWNPGPSASNTVMLTVAPYTHMPLAYGYFGTNGSPGSTSGNITCVWSTTDSDYQCTITGESVLFSKYVVTATVADINLAAMISANSVTNKVAVRIFNPSGAKIQAPFYLVVFKP